LTVNKYCGLASAVSDGGLVIIEDNDCIRSPTFTVAGGFYSETAVIFRRNRVRGGRYGIQCACQIDVRCDVYGNLVIDQHDAGVALGGHTTTAKVNNNTIVGSPHCIETNTSSDAVHLKNNIVGNCTVGIKENKGRAVHTEQNNLFWNVGTAIMNTTSLPLGPGSRVADPLFVGKDDYRTRAMSPARRSGVPWGDECVDVRGKPCLEVPDIGALQANSDDDDSEPISPARP
jgi:hypothetical protein